MTTPTIPKLLKKNKKILNDEDEEQENMETTFLQSLSQQEEEDEEEDEEEEGELEDDEESSTKICSKQSREWKLLLGSKTSQCSITIKTRNDEASQQVPERLYSSLKYELYHQIPVCGMFDSTKEEIPAVIMLKIQIVDPSDHKREIKKQNGQNIIKGTETLTPITINAKKTALEVKHKIQFTDVSYHFEKKYFCFKIYYFKPENLVDPIYVSLSSPFQVFARRPRRPKQLKKPKTSTSSTVSSTTISSNTSTTPTSKDNSPAVSVKSGTKRKTYPANSDSPTESKPKKQKISHTTKTKIKKEISKEKSSAVDESEQIQTAVTKFFSLLESNKDYIKSKMDEQSKENLVSKLQQIFELVREPKQSNHEKEGIPCKEKKNMEIKHELQEEEEEVDGDNDDDEKKEELEVIVKEEEIKRVSEEDVKKLDEENSKLIHHNQHNINNKHNNCNNNSRSNNNHTVLPQDDMIYAMMPIPNSIIQEEVSQQQQKVPHDIERPSSPFSNVESEENHKWFGAINTNSAIKQKKLRNNVNYKMTQYYDHKFDTEEVPSSPLSTYDDNGMMMETHMILFSESLFIPH